MDRFFSLAYLDPGSGSMLLQAIVGGASGLAVLVRHLFRSWKFRHAMKSVPATTEEASPLRHV